MEVDRGGGGYMWRRIGVEVKRGGRKWRWRWIEVEVDRDGGYREEGE